MKDYLRRHIWILSKLYENPKGLTYKEFEYEWGRTELNSLKTPLPKRTFADCLRAIEEAFDIQISSDVRNGYRYRIVNREWLEKDNVKDWLLSACCRTMKRAPNLSVRAMSNCDSLRAFTLPLSPRKQAESTSSLYTCPGLHAARSQ